MQTVVGVFQASADAYRAVGELKSRGLEDEKINLLVPGDPDSEARDVPTTDAEQPGVGAALGGVVGGALGAASGMSLGAAAASALIPGVGPVIAFGMLGAALLGAAGAAGGVVVADALEEDMSEGLPADELYVYEDALRQGRSVVVVQAEDDAGADTARAVLTQSGAESIDAAREQWWVGLRDAEQADYSAEGLDFTRDEPVYRRGFEAAQDLRARGKSYQESEAVLAARHPEACREAGFRRGYERGRAYYDRIKETHTLTSKRAESGKRQ